MLACATLLPQRVLGGEVGSGSAPHEVEPRVTLEPESRRPLLARIWYLLPGSRTRLCQQGPVLNTSSV